MNEEDMVMCVCTYLKSNIVKYYSATKKNEILPFTTIWMELECIMLSETSQSGKDKYHMISFICGI